MQKKRCPSWCRAQAGVMVRCCLAAAGPFLLLLLLLSTGPVRAQSPQALKKELIGAQPAWVQPVQAPLDQALAAEQVRQGVHFLLSDVQLRVDGKQRQHFRHYAMKALNGKGLESVANIEIRFDPAYEKLSLHSIAVHREGRRIERLPTTQLRVLQREKELDYLIFDGSKTAHAFLDDVRVGDVVEYAYTLSGSNPVFGERFFGGFDLQWSSPVSRLQARLLWPEGRPLHLKALGGAQPPQRRLVNGEQELVWRAEAQPGLQPSPDAPSWYDPYAQVQWGDFGSWADVAAWALPLYRTPDRLSPTLQAEVQRIAALSRDPRARTAEALRLVQREVRYLGVEVGAGSHAPNPPELVFKRRFGDCKDKTLLTLTLLRALGVRAQAALVHTQQRQAIAQSLPRPGAFNHVIVRAEIDGKSYWLDPTRSAQPGPLDAIPQASYGQALLVDAASTALSAMEVSPTAVYKRRIAVLLDASAGLAEPALMTVRTELEGLSAEQTRASLAAENAAELQQRYLNYYARSYPGISLEQAFEVQEGPAGSNRLTLIERYRLKDFFARSETQKRLEATMEVPELLAYLQSPRDLIRNAPLAVQHPQEVFHELELRLPESWTFRDDVSEVKDPAFALRREVKGEAQRLRISDHYRSLADHVLPADTAAYAANIDKARKMLGYVVYKNDGVAAGPVDAAAAAAATADDSASQLNLPVMALALLLLLAYAQGARRLYTWNPPAPPSALAGDGEALDGALLLLALGILISGGVLLHGAWSVLPIFGLQTWNALTVHGGASYHPAMAPLLLTEIAVLAAQLVGWCLLAAVFFKRRSSAVRIYLVYSWGAWGLSALDEAAIRQIPVLAGSAEAQDSLKTLLSAAVLCFWTWYLLSSPRVARTFVRRHPGTALVVPEVPPAAQAPVPPQSFPPSAAEAMPAQSAQL